MKTVSWKFVGIAIAVAAGHLAVVAYMLSKTGYSRGLQVVYDVLSFPLVYIDRLNYRGSVPSFLDFDWVPALVIRNSLLWGVAFATLWLSWYRWKGGHDPHTTATRT